MITSREFVLLATQKPFSGSPTAFVAWLNQLFTRAPFNLLTLETPDVRWLLGYKDAPKPRDLPFNLEKKLR